MMSDASDNGQNGGAHRSAAAIGRTLPHSLEAEEYLLSCCLLDGADAVSRCLESRIKPESFYDSKHSIIYDRILDLFNRKKPIDISVVAEELKTTRQLDQVGGYAFLTQVSGRIPTGAQTSYFIDKVREQSLLREIIRSATGAVEECYGFSGGIDEFAGQIRDRIDSVVAGATGAEQLLRECEYNPNAPEVKEKIVFRLAEVPMFTAGDIANLVSSPGVGKSAVIGAILAAAMTVAPDGKDFLGFSGRNFDGLPLLHFDTEQSSRDYQQLIWRAQARAGLARVPPWFHSYHLTGKPAPECRQTVETAISRFARKAGGLFMVLIDGWADLLKDPNDSEEAFGFVARMHALAIKHDMPIIGVLHLNPGSEEKSRGHLGSQLERKVGTLLQLEMDAEQITTLWAKKRRGPQLVKDRGPRFCWNNEKGMHTLLQGWSPETAAAATLEKRAGKISRVDNGEFRHIEMLAIYPPSTSRGMNFMLLHREAMESSSVSKDKFDRIKLDLIHRKLVEIKEKVLIRTKAGDELVARASGRDSKQQQEEIEL